MIEKTKLDNKTRLNFLKEDSDPRLSTILCLAKPNKRTRIKKLVIEVIEDLKKRK